MIYFCYMKDEPLELLQKVLRDKRYSVTRARQHVFELLLDHKPQSMHELNVRATGKIDRASLYRTISLFEHLGVVQRIYIGWKYKIELSDAFLHHHHHISCLTCGKIMAIQENIEIEQLINKLGQKYDITTDRHQLEIQGYCKACRTLQPH